MQLLTFAVEYFFNEQYVMNSLLMLHFNYASDNVHLNQVIENRKVEAKICLN